MNLITFLIICFSGNIVVVRSITGDRTNKRERVTENRSLHSLFPSFSCNFNGQSELIVWAISHLWSDRRYDLCQADKLQFLLGAVVWISSSFSLLSMMISTPVSCNGFNLLCFLWILCWLWLPMILLSIGHRSIGLAPRLFTLAPEFELNQVPEFELRCPYRVGYTSTWIRIPGTAHSTSFPLNLLLPALLPFLYFCAITVHITWIDHSN